MNIEIKRLTTGDEAVLEHVAIDVFDEAIHLTLLKAYLAEANHHMIVAMKDGEVIGQIRAVIHKQSGNSYFTSCFGGLKWSSVNLSKKHGQRTTR